MKLNCRLKGSNLKFDLPWIYGLVASGGEGSVQPTALLIQTQHMWSTDPRVRPPIYDKPLQYYDRPDQ